MKWFSKNYGFGGRPVWLKWIRTIDKKFHGHHGKYLDVDLRRIAAHLSIQVVFDVGGNEGAMALELSRLFPSAPMILGIPPFMKSVKLWVSTDFHCIGCMIGFIFLTPCSDTATPCSFDLRKELDPWRR